ncbi:hypothetical protein BCR44DRAFT_116747 [Catenaria anguillulae PL171]|uniref:NAD(P)-binding domain-containing protein n=1 Tax=Catenaria anguillulae PL171 TaxID=765915 RepID=A0A1Y2HND0_9FUNG|nr:hypothetical protein BCR44DRAFT_116747 [Catenaria anguillulae PL171]
MASAVVLGHTGAVGKALLRELMADARFAKVTVVGRREIEYSGPNADKLVQKVVDFENLDAHRPAFAGHSVAFCSLGTTRADAGSADRFRRIDHDYVVNAAKLIGEESGKQAAAGAGVHFLYVSSTGANASSYMLYPKTKGEIELALKGTPGLGKVSIFRPALLEVEGAREGKTRFGENVAHTLLPVFKFFSPQGISCPVGTVAKAMVSVFANPHQEPYHIYENRDIYKVVDDNAPAQ